MKNLLAALIAALLVTACGGATIGETTTTVAALETTTTTEPPTTTSTSTTTTSTSTTTTSSTTTTTTDPQIAAEAFLLVQPVRNWTKADIEAVDPDTREEIFIIRVRDLGLPDGYDPTDSALIDFGFNCCQLLREYNGNIMKIIEDSVTGGYDDDFRDILTTGLAFSSLLCPEYQNDLLRFLSDVDSLDLDS